MLRRICLFVTLVLALLLISSSPGAAQSPSFEAAARAAQWDGYALPAGTYVRYINREKGYWMWRPESWSESVEPDGVVTFSSGPIGPRVIVFSEEIPDGLGVANYTTATLQGLRKQAVREETLGVRRVYLSGIEARELTFEIEAAPDSIAHETMWLAAVGPRAYIFLFVAPADQVAQHEPSFKRLISTVGIAAAGRWDEGFEALRARFAAPATPGAETAAALLAERVRSARETREAALEKLTTLSIASPAAVLDLLTHGDPQVRALAAAALGATFNRGSNHGGNSELLTDALVWALRDPNVSGSVAAARALAARGPALLEVIKPKLAALASDRAAVIRLAAALEEEPARALTSLLLGGQGVEEHLAGLAVAIALRLPGLDLPYAKLLAARDERIGVALAEAVRVRPSALAALAASELLKLYQPGAESERWVARALGEIGGPEVGARFEARITEIDKRLGVVTVTASSDRAKRRRGKNDPPPPPMLVGSAENAVAWEKRPETVRLALARGALYDAANKIRWRDRWARAVDEKERRALRAEIERDHGDLSAWAAVALRPPEGVRPEEVKIDAARLKDAPSTGETLLPQNATLYLAAKDFSRTLARLDEAIAGVQMNTVRDQMNFALVVRMLKAQIAAALRAESGELSAALGIDLAAPISMAAWPGEEADGATGRSAVVLRVSDRGRFEQMLASYQTRFGGFDSFVATSSFLARFTAIAPAAAPIILAAAATEIPATALTRPIRRAVIADRAPLYFRRDEMGGLPVTVIERTAVEADLAVRESIYIAYLGATALIAPSREALLDALATGMGRPSLTASEAYARAREEKGEIIFFSRIEALYGRVLEEDRGGRTFAALTRALGIESGALQLTPTSWETVFHLTPGESDLGRSFRPFEAGALAAPRDLLPRETVFYAGAMVDPARLWQALRQLGEGKSTETSEPPPAEKSEPVFLAGFEGEFERTVIPALAGEVALAVLSLQPLFTEGAGWPALALALKLKGSELSAQFREGRLFPGAKRVAGARFDGSPVAALGAEGGAPFVTVTAEYLILAESAATFRLLKGPEKFAATRDYARTVAGAPGRLLLLATYHLEAALLEAQGAIAKNESFSHLLPLIGAVTHAFHSQRAYLAVDGARIEGRLAVAFDREGRYEVGAAARSSEEFDLANAIIAPKGISLVDGPRTDALTLRVKARQKGVAPRIRDDVSVFEGQRVEGSDEMSVVFSARARHIPATLTTRLPVAATAALAPYLRPSGRIRSDAEEVTRLAREITGSDRDARRVARKLAVWTSTNLKWKRVESDAIETLASREADCLEHAELYVALARAVGLPSRVVSGAAFSAGSFGAHAWVEVYLGRWVELDPTWGLFDYVDATHLRFEGNAFASYVMLNQIELEVVATRASVAAFQRDPGSLLAALAIAPPVAAEEVEPEPKKGARTGAKAKVKQEEERRDLRELAFDQSLVVDHLFGAGAWAKYTDPQRAALTRAFDRVVADQLEEWATGDAVRVLRREDAGSARIALTALRGNDLLRVSLAARDGAWYVVEITDLDTTETAFAAALRPALDPRPTRDALLRLDPDRTLSQVGELIKSEGESAELLFIKAMALAAREMIKAWQREEKTEPLGPSRDEASELLAEIIRRWPDFAPARFMLAGRMDIEGETWKLCAAQYEEYARLVPFDPRPWSYLASLYEETDPARAEAALREVLARDPLSLSARVDLIAFHLRQGQAEKARAGLIGLFRAAPGVDAAFVALTAVTIDEDEATDSERLARYESLLLAFPKEVGASRPGLRALSDAQHWQKKHQAALRTISRVISLQPEAEDYVRLARFNRALERFAPALAAADRAAKLDPENISVHLERAYTLTSLGRHAEAVAALARAVERWPFLRQVIAEDEDLKPLVGLPAFKALIAPPRQ